MIVEGLENQDVLRKLELFRQENLASSFVSFLICIFFIRNDKPKNTNSAVIHKHNSIPQHDYKFSLIHEKEKQISTSKKTKREKKHTHTHTPEKYVKKKKSKYV